MIATDKQIKYLTDLTNKVNYIIGVWPQCGVERYNIDWSYERSKGMTSLDASLKINAFKSLLRGINLKRYLLGLKQF